MKKIILPALLLALLLYCIYFFFQEKRTTQLKQQQLIAQQIKNVSKLVVSEGHFSEIITYNDNKNYFDNLLSFNKKAIVIVNAQASVAYDLHQLRYKIDSIGKIIHIVQLPQPELKITPQLQYYDLQESQFNSFTAHDHNHIHQEVDRILREKISASSLMKNAAERLLQELSKLLLVAQSANWELRYGTQNITTEKDLELFIPAKP